jgi:hypothetical protein
MFRTEFVEKIKTHILYKITYFRQRCRVRDNVEKYCRPGLATDDNMEGAHAGQPRLQIHTQNM